MSSCSVELSVSLMMQREMGFFQAAVGNLVFLSNCNGELGILLELRWGTLNSSHVSAGESVHSRMEAGKSGFFSSCGGKIDVPFKL